MVKEWVERSAFLTKPLFGVFWRSAMSFLRAKGEHRFVDCLMAEQFREIDGSLDADWRTGFDSGLPAPFSTYSCNAVEALWKLLDDSTEECAGHGPRRNGLPRCREHCKPANIRTCWIRGCFEGTASFPAVAIVSTRSNTDVSHLRACTAYQKPETS